MASNEFMSQLRQREFLAALGDYLQISTLDDVKKIKFKIRFKQIVEDANFAVSTIKDKFTPRFAMRYELRKRLLFAFEEASKLWGYELHGETGFEEIAIPQGLSSHLWDDCLCSGIQNLIDELDAKPDNSLVDKSVDEMITAQARNMFFNILELLIDSKIKLSRAKDDLSDAGDKLLDLIEKSFICAGFRFGHIPNSGLSKRQAENFRNFFRNETMRASEKNPLIRIINIELDGIQLQGEQHFFRDRYIYFDPISFGNDSAG